MQLSITHTTRYTYDCVPSGGLLQVRIRPQTGPGQTVHDWTVDLMGARAETSYTDAHGNAVDLLSLQTGAATMTVTVSGDVETVDAAGVVGPHAQGAPLWAYRRTTPLTRAGEAVRDLADGVHGSHGSIDALHDLSARILSAVPYGGGRTDAATAAEAALTGGLGVCQDHTHIFLSAARHLGYPARYVSGYLMMNDRVDQDASHAWAEAHVEGLGWIGFDVSNAICPDDRYVRIARGLDYRGAAPASGVVTGAGRSDLSVSVQVQQ